MPQQHRTAISRKSLLLIAAIGLLLTEGHSLFGLVGKQKTFSSLLGNVIFLYAVWKIFSPNNVVIPTESSESSNNRKTLISGLAGLTFLIVNRFGSINTWVHAALVIAGWLLVILCFSFPKSRWQDYVGVAAYVVILSTVQWRMFSAFASMDTQLLCGCILLWILVTGSIFLFLMRRKTSSPPPALH